VTVITWNRNGCHIDTRRNTGVGQLVSLWRFVRLGAVCGRGMWLVQIGVDYGGLV
jgi:hypothetical protein